MFKKMFFTGIVSIVAVIILYRCTPIEYNNNPLDLEGDFKEGIIRGETDTADSNHDGIANYWDNRRDTTHPVIKILDGDTVTIQKDDPTKLVDYYKTRISTSDPGGGKITVATPVDNVNIYKINTVPYTIIYTASDTSGNTTTATRYVYIVDAPQGPDTTPPMLSLNYDTMYVIQGGVFTDPGATAFDLKDGDLRSKVVATGTVNVNVPGTYTITYSVSDIAGNPASIKRVVIVSPIGTGTDNVPPVITLKGADTLFVPTGQTITTYVFVEPGYTAYDSVDGDLTAKVDVSKMTFLSSQYWYFDYTVKDNAGNWATPRRRYINTGVNPRIPPSIELVHPDSIIQIILGNTWEDPGFSAIDIDDGDITAKVIVNDTNVTNNIDKVGNYQVYYMVTNTAGVTVQKIRYVTITESEFDTKPPVITLLGRNPDTTLAGGAAYKDPGATALDNRDGDVTANITVSGTVNVKTIGKYTLTYRCKDKAGFTGTETRIVYVVRDTLTTDILVRYNVPTETPLPDMSNLTFATVDIDGDGPAAVKTAIKSHTINWSLTEKNLRGFSFQYVASPYYKEISSGVKQTFSESQPMMTISGSEVTGLDGSYYVTYVKGEFIWVNTKGKFAIIWSK